MGTNTVDIQTLPPNLQKAIRVLMENKIAFDITRLYGMGKDVFYILVIKEEV